MSNALDQVDSLYFSLVVDMPKPYGHVNSPPPTPPPSLLNSKSGYLIQEAVEGGTLVTIFFWAGHVA